MTPPSWPAATLPGPSAPWPHDGAGPAMRSALAVGASPTAPRPRGAGRGGSQVLDMRQRERQEACSPADRASGQGAACRAPSPAQRGAGRGGGRPGLGGLWLLLVPVEGCGGPLLVAGLAAARTLAWGWLGIALAAGLAGVLLAAWLRRRSRARDGVGEGPGRCGPTLPEIPPR